MSDSEEGADHRPGVWLGHLGPLGWSKNWRGRSRKELVARMICGLEEQVGKR